MTEPDFPERLEDQRNRLQEELRKTAADPNATAEDAQRLVDEAMALQKAQEGEPIAPVAIASRTPTGEELHHDALEAEQELCACCAKAKGTEFDGEARLVCKRCKRKSQREKPQAGQRLTGRRR